MWPFLTQILKPATIRMTVVVYLLTAMGIVAFTPVYVLGDPPSTPNVAIDEELYLTRSLADDFATCALFKRATTIDELVVDLAASRADAARFAARANACGFKEVRDAYLEFIRLLDVTVDSLVASGRATRDAVTAANEQADGATAGIFRAGTGIGYSVMTGDVLTGFGLVAEGLKAANEAGRAADATRQDAADATNDQVRKLARLWIDAAARNESTFDQIADERHWATKTGAGWRGIAIRVQVLSGAKVPATTLASYWQQRVRSDADPVAELVERMDLLAAIEDPSPAADENFRRQQAIMWMAAAGDVSRAAQVCVSATPKDAFYDSDRVKWNLLAARMSGYKSVMATIETDWIGGLDLDARLSAELLWPSNSPMPIRSWDASSAPDAKLLVQVLARSQRHSDGLKIATQAWSVLKTDMIAVAEVAALEVGTGHDDEAVTNLRYLLSVDGSVLQLIRKHPVWAALWQRKALDMRDLTTPQITWAVDFGMFFDSIFLTNKSSFALTRVTFTPTIIRLGQVYSKPLVADRIEPGETYKWLGVFSIPDSIADSTSASLTCAEDATPKR